MSINQTFNSYYLEMSILDNYYGEGKSIRDKIIELEEEIKKLEIDKIHWRDLYWEECEKNKRLKECYIKLSKIVDTTGGYRAKYVNELRDKITMLEQENKKLKAEIQEWLNAFRNM